MRSWPWALLLPWIAVSAHGNSIGLFADESCTSCNLTIPMGATGTVHVRAVPGNFTGQVAGAEFRIVGLPEGWFAFGVADPAVTVVVGNPLGDGTNLAFATPQEGSCVPFFRLQILATTAENDVVLRVARHTTPSNPVFSCPRLIIDCGGACDTWTCSGGGELFVNSSRVCSVGVEASTWSSVKDLYRE